eukprot:GHVR01164287.1.p1 GENE.GHVR01164287.1~~GHVR01164287.1.p1  ORF type:complete len:479 (-),score=60.20 GHVR01164287.1:10-1446(-)
MDAWADMMQCRFTTNTPPDGFISLRVKPEGNKETRKRAARMREFLLAKEFARQSAALEALKQENSRKKPKLEESDNDMNEEEESSIAQPTVMEPAPAEPAATEPAPAEPAATEPMTMEPARESMTEPEPVGILPAEPATVIANTDEVQQDCHVAPVTTEIPIKLLVGDPELPPYTLVTAPITPIRCSTPPRILEPDALPLPSTPGKDLVLGEPGEINNNFIPEFQEQELTAMSFPLIASNTSSAGPTMASRPQSLALNNMDALTSCRRMHPYDRQNFVVQEINYILDNFAMAGQHFRPIQEEMVLATSEQTRNTELLQMKIREQEDQLTAKEHELTAKEYELTAKQHELTEKNNELAELHEQPKQVVPDDATRNAVAGELKYIEQLLTRHSYRVTAEVLRHRVTSSSWIPALAAQQCLVGNSILSPISDCLIDHALVLFVIKVRLPHTLIVNRVLLLHCCSLLHGSLQFYPHGLPLCY